MQILKCWAVHYSYWINNFGSDFKSSQDVRMQLLEFQNEVQLDVGNKAAHLLDLEKWYVKVPHIVTSFSFVVFFSESVTLKPYNF